MYHVPLTFQCIYVCSDERDENGEGEDEKEWRLPGLLYADGLVLCEESEEDLRAMVGWYVQVCRRSRLKFNVVKNKLRVLGGEDGLECEVYVDEMQLEHALEFKYLGCVLNESGKDKAEFRKKVVSGRRVQSAIRSLGYSLRLLESCLLLRMEVWKEKERSRIRAVQVDNVRGLLGIRRWIKSRMHG